MKKTSPSAKVDWKNVIMGVALGSIFLLLIFMAWIRFVAGVPLSTL
ncbi:MAG: hypothetical protein WD889_00430 [Candidatus Colwellbacteria bacterium]